MFIPIGTDRRSRRRPVVNQSLIAINVVAYLLILLGAASDAVDLDRLVGALAFQPADPRWWQILTYQFVHDPGGIGHILFNMIFLWVFGNAVEDRLRHLGYLAFYLIGGVVAGLAHAMIEDAPVIGASGSISAVSGAFLALFPRARIKVLVLFLIIGFVEIPAAWFIGAYFLIDLLSQTMDLLGRTSGEVAYAAHLAGSVYGFVLALTLLAVGLLKHEEFDIFYLFKQSRRRRAFRSVLRRDEAVWDTARAESAEELAARRRRRRHVEEDAKAEKLAALRRDVAERLARGDLDRAADRYVELLREHPDLVLTERTQADVANRLYERGTWPRAAAAYELLLKHYPRTAEAARYELILALIYARHLGRTSRARELLEKALPRLREEGERRLAERLRDELPEPAR